MILSLLQTCSESQITKSPDINRAVQARPLNLHNYRHENIYTRVYQTANLSSLGRKRDESHCPALDGLTGNCKSNHASCTITMYLSASVNTEAALFVSAMPNFDCKKQVKDGSFIIINDEWHSHHSV